MCDEDGARTAGKGCLQLLRLSSCLALLEMAAGSKTGVRTDNNKEQGKLANWETNRRRPGAQRHWYQTDKGNSARFGKLARSYKEQVGAQGKRSMLRVAPRMLSMLPQLHWKGTVGKGTSLRT